MTKISQCDESLHDILSNLLSKQNRIIKIVIINKKNHNILVDSFITNRNARFLLQQRFVNFRLKTSFIFFLFFNQK